MNTKEHNTGRVGRTHGNANANELYNYYINAYTNAAAVSKESLEIGCVTRSL